MDPPNREVVFRVRVVRDVRAKLHGWSCVYVDSCCSCSSAIASVYSDAVSFDQDEDISLGVLAQGFRAQNHIV